MNIVNLLTTYDLERLLATQQIKHYIYFKQTAAAIGNKAEYRRATDVIDQLTTEHGISALHLAQEEYK
ncbi:hypothetical protein CER19_11785 [Pseudomonas sp. GL93]|uniref:hypothetical protein n=1 Tax=Pseudomonas sp. GL93 TaxID=2014741 RepID=UPI000E321EF2|nr:hypothetical protein [Pseudomonas sp. GL93]RFD29216.1 hypothetical protein CER19_11785 [Pseudomonas sp. GL93]